MAEYNIISIISIILSALSLIAWIILIWKQYKISKKLLTISQSQLIISKNSVSGPILVDMFREFRNIRFKTHMDYIINVFYERSNEFNPDMGYSKLPTKTQKSVKIVSHFFDHLGTLVAHSIIDDEPIIGYMGESIDNIWKILEPYIKAERVARPTKEYQEYFEDLVIRIRKNPPSKIRENLREVKN